MLLGNVVVGLLVSCGHGFSVGDDYYRLFFQCPPSGWRLI